MKYSPPNIEVVFDITKQLGEDEAKMVAWRSHGTKARISGSGDDGTRIERFPSQDRAVGSVDC